MVSVDPDEDMDMGGLSEVGHRTVGVGRAVMTQEAGGVRRGGQLRRNEAARKERLMAERQGGWRGLKVQFRGGPQGEKDPRKVIGPIRAREAR